MQAITHWIRGHVLVLACVAIGIGIVGCGAWALTRPETAVETDVGDFGQADGLPEAEQAEPTEVATIIVYISGAVRAPDVYRLPGDARVKDLVLAAGGFTEEADPDQINLADRLTDAQHIKVARQSAGEAPAAASSQGASDKLNLNTASADDLEGLPGIGTALAERIVTYRSENGPLTQVEDLRKVKGIAGSVYDKIAPLVSVGS